MIAVGDTVTHVNAPDWGEAIVTSSYPGLPGKKRAWYVDFLSDGPKNYAVMEYELTLVAKESCEIREILL